MNWYSRTNLNVMVFITALFFHNVISVSSAYAEKSEHRETFHVGGKEMTMAVPSGYCVPTGKLGKKFRRRFLRHSDKMLVHLIFVNCEELKTIKRAQTAKDLGRVRSSKKRRNEKWTQTEFFKELVNPFRSETLITVTGGTLRIDENRFEKMMNTIDYERPGNLGPLHSDMYGLYMGELSKYLFNKQDLIIKISVMVVVKERLLYLYFDRKYENPEMLVNFLREVIGVVTKFVSENET